MNCKRRLILFARYPVAGRVKTRLVPALGAEAAVGLHRRLVLRTLRTAHGVCQAKNIELQIHFDGGTQEAMSHWLGSTWRYRRQGEGDLGERMAEAFDDSFREGASATVVIGSDCPSLSPAPVLAAFDALQSHSVVFGPATDGGYYLVGLTRPIPRLFQGVPWGTNSVLKESLAILSGNGDKPALLEPLDDLDRPEDLSSWQRIVQSEESKLRRVTVIIPALNEAAQIAETIASARAGHPHEIIVVDGGSQDATRELAQQAGATVITSRPGRSGQMNAGASLATGDVLLFLHADTLLPSSWGRVASEILQRPGISAGAFRFKIAEAFPGKWIVESTTNFRSRWFQTPYGDQALFMRRSLFEELGGFEDLPVMEDYELVRRLRARGRIITAEELATTSGRRWKNLGFVRTTLTNKLMVTGYHLGVPPSRLAALYRNQRGRDGRHQ